MHEAAVADGSEQKRQSKVKAKNARAQCASRNRDRMPRPKRDVFENAAVFAQRYLALGAAIQIIKHRLWYAPLRDWPEILDADHSWGCY
jgi:hypothetical protein